MRTAQDELAHRECEDIIEDIERTKYALNETKKPMPT